MSCDSRAKHWSKALQIGLTLLTHLLTHQHYTPTLGLRP